MAVGLMVLSPKSGVTTMTRLRSLFSATVRPRMSSKSRIKSPRSCSKNKTNHSREALVGILRNANNQVKVQLPGNQRIAVLYDHATYETNETGSKKPKPKNHTLVFDNRDLVVQLVRTRR